MNTTKIFKHMTEFMLREDQSVNGVSQDFIDEMKKSYPDYDYQADNATNTGCWCCYKCTNCERCSLSLTSHYCTECYFIARCHWCKKCEDCNDCRYCENCTMCAYGQLLKDEKFLHERPHERPAETKTQTDHV